VIHNVDQDRVKELVTGESDVISTGATEPDKTTCNACGKTFLVKSFKYSHQKTCSGLKEKKEKKPLDKDISPVRKPEMKFDDEAADTPAGLKPEDEHKEPVSCMIPLRRHPPPPQRVIEVRTHPDHNTVVEPRIHRANMRNERMARISSSAIYIFVGL
jgi:hypothetical protein